MGVRACCGCVLVFLCVVMMCVWGVDGVTDAGLLGAVWVRCQTAITRWRMAYVRERWMQVMEGVYGPGRRCQASSLHPSTIRFTNHNIAAAGDALDPSPHACIAPFPHQNRFLVYATFIRQNDSNSYLR